MRRSRAHVTKKTKALGASEPSTSSKFVGQYMKEAFTSKANELGESAEAMRSFSQVLEDKDLKASLSSSFK